MEMSKAFTEWVSAPTEMMSTPVFATSAMVSWVIPPEASGKSLSADELNGGLHGCIIHVVKHNDVGACLDGLFDLVEISRFNLDFDRVAERLPENSDGLGNSAAGVDVVVLKHGAVGKIETVVCRRRRQRRIFEGREARKGLSRVGDACVCAETRPTHLAVSVAMPDIC